MSDVYFNVLIIIIEKITFQINSFTFIFLGKDVLKGEVQSRPLPEQNCQYPLKYATEHKVLNHPPFGVNSDLIYYGVNSIILYKLVITVL